ncbi:MAG: gamma-glutamyltransferase [Ornithinimicrobium sp.]
MTFTTRPTLQGTFGMVSSTHWMASAAAMGILERGGNAFDAAVCAGFVLHVVEPHLNGPGGDLPAIVSLPGGGAQVLCGQGPAPAAATAEHFVGAGLDMVPGSGPLAAAVPGAFDAWMLLLRDRGTMSVADVLAPAEHYARHGVPVLPTVQAAIEGARDIFIEHWPTSARLWLHGSGRHAPAAGSLHTNVVWADTLAVLIREASGPGASRERQIDRARSAWSQGFVAERIGAFAQLSHRHIAGQVLPGVITAQDCASFAATWEQPTVLRWHGQTIAKTGPWGQGPTLLQVLAMREIGAEQGAQAGFDVAAPLDSAAGIHALLECWKLVMADREAWYGDSPVREVNRPDAVLTDLLDPQYAGARQSGSTGEAQNQRPPGRPGGRRPRMPALAGRLESQQQAGGDATLGEPTVRPPGPPDGDTCHVDVVDRWGNMIAATPSGGWLQSSPAIADLGFALGTRLQMMWLEQGLPSSLVPGARPRSTLSPTMVLRGGEAMLACGSPGGDQQDQWQSVFLIRHLLEGHSLQEAIDAPMFHSTSFTGSFYPRLMDPGGVVAETRLGEAVLNDLERRGHRVQRSGPWSLSRLCAVARDPQTGLLSAGANPRGMQGYAVGR